MGERKDLIKFGPEWLRNLSSERNDTSNATSRPTSSAATNSRLTRTVSATSTSLPVSHTTSTSVTTTAATADQASGGGAVASGSGAVASGSTASANQTSSKVQLAKLRYGREEMLALFDTTSARAPAELKHNDVLYLARCKAPFALQETFEDTDAVARENPKPSGIGTTDFGRGRGISRPAVGGSERGRVRPINRHGIGRGTGAMDQRSNSWNAMNMRMGLPPAASEDTSSSQRPWHNSASGIRLPNEHSEWHNKVFKSKRPGNNSTNWRQGHRDDGGDEWRSSDLGRSRSNNNLVDREWGDRHRRTWGSGEPHDELPEWFDNPDAGAGTFDATGAFHGVSNDDTSVPKTQETAHPLTRSHTHGSFERFERSRNFEENTEDWWASEKAQKLSPKKFETGEKFRQQSAAMPDVNTGMRRAESHGSLEEISMKLENRPGSSASNSNAMFKPQFERKAFNPLGRTDLEKASGQGGNFQSVMITSNTNNSLRQKHQNLVPPSERQKPEEGAMDEMLHFPLERHAPTVTTMVTCTVTSTVAGITNARGQNSFADLMQMSTRIPFVVPQSIRLNMAINRAMNSDFANVPVMPNPGAIARGITPIGIANPDMNHIAAGDALGGSGTMGSTPLGKAALGNSGMGSATMGTTAMGSAAMGSSAMGSAAMGSSVMGSAAMGSAAMGSSAMGSAVMGSAAIGSGAMGNAAIGSAAMGNAAMGNAAMGNAAMGSASMGNAAMGSAAMGSAAIGNAAMGSAAMGSAAMGNAAMGNAAMGNAAMGNAAMGNAAMSNAAMSSAAMGSALPLAGNTVLGGMTSAVLGNPMTKTGLGSARISNPTINDISLSNAGSVNETMSLTGLPVSGMPHLDVHGRGPNYAKIQMLRAMEMQNQGNQLNIYQMQGFQHPSNSNAYNPLYGNVMHGVQPGATPSDPSEHEWYYEDPEKNIQGPFSTAEMYYWYSAGFFNNTMLVRRSCDSEMRPLGTYGPMPFNVMTYSVQSGYDDLPQDPRYTLLTNPTRISSHMMPNMPVNSIDSLQYGPLDLMRNPSIGQQPMDSLWGQPNSVLGWRQQNVQPAVETEQRPSGFANGLGHVIWDQRSGIRLPEEIAKEMKTEDEILAQLRANQVNTKQNSPYPSGQPVVSAAPNNANTADISLSPSLGDLHQIIKLDSPPPNPSTTALDGSKILPANESPQISEQSVVDDKKDEPVASKACEINKQVDKSSKSKENSNATKSKSKKSKEEKKEEPVPEAKVKEDENSQAERQVEVPVTPKAVQKEKSSKKEIEKENKIWAKDTYALVKGADKSSNKDLKKKAEEAKVAEEAERKRKEEERLAVEEEKKRKQAELLRKQQEFQQRELLQRASESVAKKAPWSFATQAMQATSNYGPTLAEIQRLEREKKLEQMKEQQHMMQIIAQHQAAALAREQEIQANLGWAKKKAANVNANPVSLAEIQAETRRKAATESSAALTQPQEEMPQPAPITTNAAPWGNNSNGDGFWDSPAGALKGDKKSDKRAVEPNKSKKKNNTVAKKEPSAAAEFDLWCNTSLSTWSSNIDVPTFVNFLKDIESPYEVKDYVKCYLGETKDANDFARHFLERRSKLLRVGMATPSDDLCSPAAAINPRPCSTSDYQEVKVKGKRGKKNKMLKVDARILGFSVTAAEDRINIGDIDMA